jgi:hypothetical protein
MKTSSRTLLLLLAFAAGLVAAAPLAAQVEVVSPQAGVEVTGKIEVEARVLPPDDVRLDRIVVQADTGEQIRMAPKFAGTYVATLDTASLKNGRQTLLVLAAPKGMDASRFKHEDNAWSSPIRNYTAEVEVVVRNPYQFYWGDLHAHTSYSDGARVPKEAYEYARDKANLDFFAVTDHCQLLTFDEYADVIAQADATDHPGRFVALYGCEVTEGTGHLNYYMGPTPRLPSRLDATLQTIGRMSLLGHFNHPNLNSPPEQGWRDDFEGFHYVPQADRSMALVELRSPGEEQAYIAMLNAGWHVGAAGCQDTHDANWGNGSTWTVALARQLSREGILEALWSRRTYSAADRNVRLTFTLDGEDMGAQLVRKAGVLSGVVAVSDPDASDAITAIDLFVDGRVLSSARPNLTSYAWSAQVNLPPGKHYCFVRITQTGNRSTWSSPIWVSTY